MSLSYSDRFIPCRSTSNFDLFHIRPPTTANAYNARLRSALFGPDSANSNIFKFKTDTKKRKQPFDDIDDPPVTAAPQRRAAKVPRKAPRKVPTSPVVTFEVPLDDDFYWNLLDWSSDNQVAVGVGNLVSTMCRSTNTARILAELDSCVCSVAWSPHSTHLAVGTDDGLVRLWDASTCKEIATMKGHRGPVNALAWSSPALLYSGSSDTTILHRDIRTPKYFVTEMTGHRGQVCGLKWSSDNEKLASGGDDDRLLVWNRHSTNPVLEYSDDTFAVKAIAWSPHKRGLLASGGGSESNCIRFWDTAADGGDGSCISSIKTSSQVCGLVWSKNVDEIVSTHGFPKNEIIVWKYPSMSKVATLTGHSKRVLYLAGSPDGRQIVTGAEDETLKFWNVFPGAPKTSLGKLSFGFRSQLR